MLHLVVLHHVVQYIKKKIFLITIMVNINVYFDIHNDPVLCHNEDDRNSIKPFVCTRRYSGR